MPINMSLHSLHIIQGALSWNTSINQMFISKPTNQFINYEFATEWWTHIAKTCNWIVYKNDWKYKH